MLYELDEEYLDLFKEKGSTSDWYEALDEIGIESFPSLDAEDSLGTWEYSLRGLDISVAKLFKGDLAAIDDDSDDPNIVFLTSKTVKEIHDELAELGMDYFARVLAAKGGEADIWLYEPMTEFLENASESGKSVVVMWGG